LHRPRAFGEMAKPALMMAVATLIGGGCDYLFQYFMSGTMTPADFSELSALLSVFYLAIAPAQVIATFLVKQSSRLNVEGRRHEIAWLIRKMVLYESVAGAAIAVALFLLLPEISSFIYLSSTFPVFLLMAGVVVSLVSPVGYGTSQGLERFRFNALYGVTGPLTKLGMGIVLVAVGFGIMGALGGVLIGLVLALVVSLYSIRDLFQTEPVPLPQPELAKMRGALLHVVIAVTCLTIMVNVDIILARQYLDPNTAGLYAVCSMLGKIILFLPSSINIVIYPKLAAAHAKRSGTVAMMRLSVLIALVVTGVVVISFFLFPSEILRLLYGGDKYIGAAAGLGILGLAMSLLGVANLFMNYGLATDSRIYLAIMVFFTALQVTLIVMFHDSLVTIALDMLVAFGGTTAVSWAYMEARPGKNVHPDV
jgi:O-antigen/teichoic acid export membrane protein